MTNPAEFNLSEKIQTLTLGISMEKPYNSNEHIEIVHVKEFIRLLKEKATGWDLEYPVHRLLFLQEIDKLAGEKLK